ncbi:hypothetical protein M422DRAFT_171761 [Sphaerobolus stellatus SS14]|uniref:Transaldolase n=1 Tax=Sphaerobolus stellatus (strain SS14) TaxID=990650 RepID=A0A0C9V573_SPHS4|nr:hypothetical protein M422DRAFT_171761 [Sphaerobolus stellatus SS14]
MSEALSQLDFLRKYSGIDCDTLDYNVARELGPFINCTSNQAIAYFEAIKPENHDIIIKAAELANDYDPDEDKCIAYGVKALMVLLSLRMLPYLTGSVLTQSTMRGAYDTDLTVKDALEIVEIYKRLSPGIDINRICIKIPSTYEGLEACQILKAKGINTLGTILFTLEQAVLAHEVGCQNVSPYVNELKVLLFNAPAYSETY